MKFYAGYFILSCFSTLNKINLIFAETLIYNLYQSVLLNNSSGVEK